MKIKKCALALFLLMAITLFTAESATAGAAGYEGALLIWDPTAPGAKVFLTVTVYFERVPQYDKNAYPAACITWENNYGVMAIPNWSPADNVKSSLARSSLVIRAEAGNKIRRFSTYADPALLECNNFEIPSDFYQPIRDKCECLMEFGASQGWGYVPLVPDKDKLVGENIFRQLIRTEVIPEFFNCSLIDGDCPSFEVKSFSTEVVYDDSDDYLYDMFDAVIAVQ
jgi:hypothetical protein